jgi:hypothetical protein
MHRAFYVVPTCFSAIIWLFWGSWNQDYFKTCSNEGRQNKHLYVVYQYVELYRFLKEFLYQLPQDGEIIESKNVGAI